MAWQKRTKPTTSWSETQVEGSALTWADCGERNLTWGDMLEISWSSLTSTDWTKRTGITTNWT